MFRKLKSLIAISPLLAGVVVGQGMGVDFSLARAVGQYQNVGAKPVPVSTGPVALSISSPENTVELKGGSVHLEPGTGGLHKVRFQARFEGEGQLITEIKLGAFPARFEDAVRVPNQEREVAGWITIEPSEEGYKVVAEEFPASVEIELESTLAGDLVTFCERMSMLIAGDAGCRDLAHALEHPKLPLPSPGSEFLVRYSDLTTDERERLDVYLEGSRLTTLTR